MDYLTFRQHCVYIEAHFSTLLTSELRVPQGPILEPILFNLCVADLSQITSESECLQSPDNSIIFL